MPAEPRRAFTQPQRDGQYQPERDTHRYSHRIPAGDVRRELRRDLYERDCDPACQVLLRLFALSTSGDPKAAADCYTAAYRARSASFDPAMAMWVQDGPATDVVIRFLDTVNNCDRFHASARMSADSFWMRGQGGGGQFFTVGPDAGGPRISETGTVLVNAVQATTQCGTAPVSRAVDVCGSLVRFISDGNTRLAQLQVAGAISEYRLEASYGTSERDPGSGMPYPARLSGREDPSSTGSPQAINLVDYTLTRVAAC